LIVAVLLTGHEARKASQATVPHRNAPEGRRAVKWWPIGIAAGIGAVLYFARAIVAHLRIGDRAVSASAVLLGVSVAVVVLRDMTL
jgi:hypothetical protein